jgi:ATP-dependent Lhr-like helicase
MAQGRWSLVRQRIHRQPSFTEWSASTAQQLLLRYGLVAREAAAAEELPGGFSAIYPALRQMEDRGWLRRGMFISGLGGSQFASNAAVETLRGLRAPSSPRATLLSAVDPANPYGSLLPWPRLPESGDSSSHGMARVSGATVLLVAGELVAYLRRGNPSLKLFLPASQPERDEYARAAAHELAQLALRRQSEPPSARSGVLISEINAAPSREHFFREFLAEAGFVLTPLGLQMRRAHHSDPEPTPLSEEDTDSDEIEPDGDAR